jgi:hypothetical protein
MSKLILTLTILVIISSSCKKYYYCACVNNTQTLTSPPNAVTPTYSTTVTTYTIPIDVTQDKSVSQCSALGGNNGTSDIICSVIK